MGKDSGVKQYKKQRHAPLERQILEENTVKGRYAPRQKARDTSRADEAEEYVNNKLSRRILEQARRQQDEIEEEENEEYEQDVARGSRRNMLSEGGNVLGLEGKKGKKYTMLDDEDASEEEREMEAEYYSDDQNMFYEELDINEEDEKALEMFMPSTQNNGQPRCLADMIMSKIKDKETEIASQISEMPASNTHLNPKVVEVYQTVGKLLKKYRSGKLPKAFKIIPSLSNWEEILFLTNPEEWSAASVYQATRIFASNLNPKMAQRYYNLILLPRIRDDVAEYKKLNFHLYMSLKKALYKPAAFFKGIVLPLCETGTSLREAIIFSSVLVKVSVPMLHSAAAMLKIAEMEYTGASSIFLRVLINKKYALPFRTIDALVFHFLRFMSDERTMPVLWHQCLLAFVQRYKEDITTEQKHAMLDLIKVHFHEKISPEIRREIVSSKSRDVEDAFEKAAEVMQM
eukprot:Nk52_evm57s239 gene=Nk52_evmTU57s239